MTDLHQNAAHAAMLLSDPVFIEIIDGLEKQAIDTCIMCGALDHEKRAAFAAEARAIRALKAKLSALIAEANSLDRDAPA